MKFVVASEVVFHRLLNPHSMLLIHCCCHGSSWIEEQKMLEIGLVMLVLTLVILALTLVMLALTWSHVQ
jgi:hypothetical protein